MGKTYGQLDMRFHGWIAAQHIFFVATAHQRPGGHVNLSPKGHADTFAVLDERTVTYLDLTGSGAETAAHLRDDGPSPSFSSPSPAHRGSCACMGRDGSSSPVSNDGTSSQRGSRPAAAPVPLLWSRSSASRTPAATAVPLYDYAGERDVLDQWAGRKDEAATAAYHAQRHSRSIDGLPALPIAAGDRQTARAEGRVGFMSDCSRNAPWRSFQRT